MTKGLKHALLGAAAAIAFGSLVGAANANPLLPEFTISPPGGSPFDANDMSFSFNSVIGLTINDSNNPFTETGSFVGNAFTNAGHSIPAGTSGLGVSYEIVANFQANGTAGFGVTQSPTPLALPSANDPLTGSFNSITMQLYYVPIANFGSLTFDNTTQEYTNLSSLAGDAEIATAGPGGTNGFGHAYIITAQTQGDFNVAADFLLTNPAGTDFFTSPSPFYLQLDTSGGTHTTIGSGNGYPGPGDYQLDQFGSGDLTFVPEPASLATFASALVILGFATRKKRQALNLS